MPRRPAPVKPDRSRLTPAQVRRLNHLVSHPEQATRRELIQLTDALLGLGGRIPDELILTKWQLERIARFEGAGRLSPQSWGNLSIDMPTRPRRPGKRPFRLADEDAPHPKEPKKRGRPPKEKPALPVPAKVTPSFRLVRKPTEPASEDAV